jgi:uncharacterized protein (DUF488 family)
METCYTFGYQGFLPEELVAKAEQLNALVLDVRFSPSSRDPRWRRQALVNVLGSRYRHAAEFGNKNYKGDGPIELADPRHGIAKVGPILLEQPVILLCACWQWSTCHRKVVADLIREEYSVEVVHLEKRHFPKREVKKKKSEQIGMFD